MKRSISTRLVPLLIAMIFTLNVLIITDHELKSSAGRLDHKEQKKLTAILQDESAQARVLTFSKGHAWSTSVGFIQSKVGIVFVKDRDEEECQVQVAGSVWGDEFTKPFHLQSIVTPCESIERPSLESLKEKTPGHNLWKLKEEQWNRVFGSQDQKEISSSDEEYKPPPSEFDCWLFEKAILYYNNNNFYHSAIRGASDVDMTLRRKLRAAADKSSTGSLDLTAVLLLTEYSQKKLATDPEFADYIEYGLLKNPRDALTRKETHLLLHKKLTGVNFEVGVLFAIAFALSDAGSENVAIQEVSDGGPSHWIARPVHFDIEFVSALAGVSLKSLHVKLSSNDPERGGHYHMPVLLSLPAVNQPLQDSTLEGLKKVSTNRLQAIAVEQLSNSDSSDDKYDGVGEIIKARIESMQHYASANPNCTLKDIAFHTISAWKRDFPDYEKENWTGRWMKGTVEWAEGK